MSPSGMTLEAAGRLLQNHFIAWRACADPDKIEALEESVADGVLALEWVTLPLDRMQLLYWLGYCCPYC